MRKWQAITGVATIALTGWTAPASANTVTDWNSLALGCITRTGPATGLDVALVQLAVHNAIQAIERQYEPYLAAPTATGGESSNAAAAAAAYRVLSDNRVCPDSAQGTLDAAFAPYLAGNDAGLAIGYAAGDALLAEYRPPTQSVIPEPFTGSTDIGKWRPTPPANAPMTFVYEVNTKPFTLDTPSQFRPDPPPTLDSWVYAREYNEVKEIGSVTSHPPTGACPAPADTDKARFWSGSIAAQWNQVARDLAVAHQLSLGDTARLLALLNVAIADAGIAVWDSKYYYNYWRPITAIREGDSDPNVRTGGDPSWTPFIQSPSHFGTPPAPAPLPQNPPYPDYVSGANGLTGAATATLQLFFGTDWMPFSINKATPAAVPICTNPRLFIRFSDAAQEVVDARILLGIHFRAADDEARRLGSRVAFWSFARTLRPLH
jgi:hypothetical protein